MVQNRCMNCGRGPGSSWPFGPYLACRETLGKALSLTGYAAARVGLVSEGERWCCSKQEGDKLTGALPCPTASRAQVARQ